METQAPAESTIANGLPEMTVVVNPADFLPKRRTFRQRIDEPEPGVVPLLGVWWAVRRRRT